MKNKTSRAKVGRILLNSFLGFLVAVSLLARLSAKWYIDVFGQVGFDSIMYTLLSDMTGVQGGLVSSYLAYALPLLITGTLFVCVVLFFRTRKQLVLTLFRKVRICLYPFPHWLRAILALVTCSIWIFQAAALVQLPEYLEARKSNSTFFENYYRDPRDVQITFPETKRNLIYIFMESMESSYQSREAGGSSAVNIIPELTQLAQKNVSFSTGEAFSGAYRTAGTGWTIAAMLAQSSGVPLILPPGYDGNDYGSDGTFLPGLYALPDLLHDNGYYQMLLVGSDASFGGRDAYYRSHQTDEIYDIYDARESGLLPSPDYDVWWGMEDAYLYACAKDELLDMAQQDQPFALTLLTVDTHHVNGYVCAYCGTEHEEQYENVLSCASRQVAEFVAWVQQQDFYENTTIIICGDHLSMDNSFFARRQYDNDNRRIFNCIINAPVTTAQTKNRAFTVLDLFPTTVAALGCTIDGERLGLGTNMFSATPTLMEELGMEWFQEEISKSTNYYFDHFFFS